MPKVHYEVTGDVGEIVLSNPPLNLFDQELIDDLHAAVGVAAEAAPRALIVRAEGKVFTAGVDVHVFEGLDIPKADALTGRLLELAHTIEDMPFPTMAVVHGTCSGRRRARGSGWWRRWWESHRSWVGRSGWPNARGPRGRESSCTPERSTTHPRFTRGAW